MTSATVTYREDNGIAWIALNRPRQLNALNEALRSDLTGQLRRAQQSADTRVVAIVGEGDRAFCAGADVKERGRRDSLSTVRLQARERTRWVDVLAYEVSKPVICGIHGYCLGGGLELALACDIRIASADAQLGLPEVTLGLIPGAGGTQRLQGVVGRGVASYMILTGERITAQQARELGLVSQVVERDDLRNAVAECAKKISRNAPIAVEMAKAAIRRSDQDGLRQGLAFERQMSQLLAFSSDLQEGAQAFREKRAPNYSGN